MRLRCAPLILLLFCGGCFPKKSPVGIWTTTLWNLPVKMTIKDNKVTVKGSYKNSPMTAAGDYTFAEKDGEADFSFNITEMQIQNGNPFTQQMLASELQNTIQPRSFKGYLKWDRVDQMEMVVESYGQDSHIQFHKESS